MRIVVTGASGNIGSHVLEALSGDDLTAVARRPPTSGPLAKAAAWRAVDISRAASVGQLVQLCRGADAVIHLAWLIQPSHDEAAMRAVNVGGTKHLLQALRELDEGNERVPALIVASSVGAYSPGPKDRGMSEAWPTDGIPTSIYSNHKVEMEKLLDAYEMAAGARVVRIRPGVVLSARAASSQARYFLGPFLPMTLLRRSLLPVIPAPADLVVPIVHSRDVAAAFAAAARDRNAEGPYNVAADDPLTPDLLAEVLNARVVRVPKSVVRGLADASWRLRLQPTDPGWLDLALQVPLMSTRRVREELNWKPTHSAAQTLAESLQGMRERTGGLTPVLRPSQGAAHQARAALPTLIPRLGKRI